MGGDSGTPTLAMLVADHALRGGDAQRAWHAVWRQATTLPASSPRGHLADYLAKGYIPSEDSDIAAPLTLEYAVDDAAVALLARRFGTPAQAAEMTRRSQSWRNLYDASSGTARPRNADGSWATPTSLGATSVYNPAFQDGWQEGTGYQWTWLVPQNPRALATAMGGTAAALQRLDEFFGTPAASQLAPAVPLADDEAGLFGVYYAGDQYAPGNETDLQAPWLYDFLGEPWATAKVVHAESQLFTDNPYGLPGNDDGGTMSAWYVLATIGLYQVTPGSSAWELSTPMFSSVRLATGTTIVTSGAGPTGEYVERAAFGGAPLSHDWIDDEDLRAGRSLTFVTTTMSSATGWASAESDEPPVVG
jgi:predicted alpha-1,2-mannosidase